MQGQLPRHTVATACYGEEPIGMRTMDFAEKIVINSLFPDVIVKGQEGADGQALTWV